MEHIRSIDYGLLYVVLPLIATSSGAIYLYFRLWHSKNKYPEPTIPEYESVIVSINKYRVTLILFSGLDMLGWLSQLILYFFGKQDYTVISTVSLIALFITWLSVFVATVSSPSRTIYHLRHYSPVFLAFFTFSLLDAVYKVLNVDDTTWWKYIHVAFCFVLFVTSGLIPQPVHPKEVQCAPNEKVEIKDGVIYRESLVLSPESTANLFSRISFQWMNPLVVFGFSNVVTRENIYALTFQHLSRFAYKDFFDTTSYLARNRILRRIYDSNKQEIWGQFIFSNLSVFLGYLSPYFQQRFLEYIELPLDRPISVAYLFILSIFASSMVQLLCDNAHLYLGRRWNVRSFAMLDAEIFSKSLKRKDMSGKVTEDDKKEGEDKDKKEEAGDDDFSNVGKITNLMSVDADRLSDIPSYIFLMYNPPVQVTVALFYLYQLLGNAALIGLVVMLVLFPVTGVLSKKFSSNYVNMSKARDSRNDLVNEMLQGIRMIKYFAWESNWKDKIFEARKTELKKVIRTVTLDVCMGLCYNTVPVLVTASSFIWYTKVEGHELTASVAFVSITLFEMLRAPLVFIPESVTTLTEAYVSLKRISSYVDEHEISENEDKTPVVIPEGVTPEAILARTGFEQSVFQWHYKKEEVTNEPNTPELPISNTASTITYTGNQSNVFQLQTPKFDFPTGKLTIVCGATGSGKSSLLHALLGEMDIVSGRVYLPSKTVMPISNYSRIDPEHPTLYLDRVAYVAQQPFLQHASIRDNILFGLPYDAQRYKSVLKQCALMKDLSILADGDRTEIGEKGISLSGGQKQRVSLARAVYSYAKTVILDDCLSAVDSHTAKHIYKNCINGNLLKGRTIILVTHHVRLCLPAANFFIKIENGQLVGCDTVAQLRTSGQLQRLLGNETVGDAGDTGEEIEGILEDDNGDFDLDLDSKAEAAKLVQDETTEKGQVKAKVYRTYLKACGGWPFWTALVLAYVIARLFSFGENWWLRIWASAYAKRGDAPMSLMSAQSSAKHGIFDTFTSTLQNQNVFRPWVFEQSEPINVDYYIGVYLLICFSFVLFDTSRVILLYWGSIRGARKLFEALLDRIIYAPMRFFDTTPVGRILNRFGKDITTIDLQISRSASFLIECTTGIAASIIIISAITPQFLIVAFGISGVYFIIGTYYLRISRELKRLNSVSRSPIYSHFTESLTGVTTIRAYGVQEEFMVTVYRKIDDYIAPFYFLWMSNRWLYARIEFTGAFVILFTGIFLIINISTIDAGMAGISLFYARSFLENIYWFIRQYTQVEMNLNSVERVQEYLEIDQEPPSVIEGHRPPAAWPTTASIEIEDLVIRYAPELDPVLHGISFKTKPHEKVGIVGRTGSGKSTMALSFFRFLEPSSGSISIDGIDITKIGIQDLRSRMTIIPQDAILFSGTIRTNLDPFNEHSDEELWESLDRAHLTRPSQRLKKDSPVSSSSNTVNGEEGHSVSSITRLEQKVSDGGNNFSQGQRQLLCLARALLKNSKLIIMDEATASVDFETDSKIQDTIRQEFTNSALLTIAHRLHTIIDYDRVLVLEQGKVIEFDTPYNLIQANSVFRSMCEKSGEFDVLNKMATASHKQKQQEEEEQDPDNHATVY